MSGHTLISEHRREPLERRDVHTEHCNYVYCKYGEEDHCPVYQGRKYPSYPTTHRPSEEEFIRRQLEIESY